MKRYEINKIKARLKKLEDQSEDQKIKLEKVKAEGELIEPKLLALKNEISFQIIDTHEDR